MKYNVDGWNNFCRVFELPDEYPPGFCFGGGKMVLFKMVDWFNPVCDIGQPAVSKEVWKEKVGEIQVREIDHDELCISLTEWLKQKIYVRADSTYLVICDFGASFTFKKGE